VKTLEKVLRRLLNRGSEVRFLRRNAFYLRKRPSLVRPGHSGRLWDLDEVVGLGEGLACREAPALAFLHT